MTKHGLKVAILHDDMEVSARVAAVASRAGLHVVRPQSFSWIEAEIADPTLAAVVVDLVGPRSGGFEALERVASDSEELSGFDDAPGGRKGFHAEESFGGVEVPIFEDEAHDGRIGENRET